MTPLRPSDIMRCFQGVIPSVIATVDASGVPNITYISQVHHIDDHHVALSRQFFNKTSRNLDATGRAMAEVYDPVTLQAYRLKLRFLRTETEGPLFRQMALRIDAIASHAGMSGVFRLIGSDVFEIESLSRVDGYLTGDPTEVSGGVPSVEGLRTEIRGLQLISDRISRAASLDELVDGVLESLEEYFGFRHTMLLMAEDDDRLVTVASRGYGESGVGAEVRLGEGLIGTAARERHVLRFTALDESLRYGRAVRREMEGAGAAGRPEIPLPGLSDAQCVLVIPLWSGDELIGALAAESADVVGFSEWHEAYLEVIGNQIAMAIERTMEDESDDDMPLPSFSGIAGTRGQRTFTYYSADDSIFIDHDYLIRNVPARILWKLLREWKETGRREFCNREIRLDPSIGLPEFRDNLESRLVLLRRRLDEKQADVRIVTAGRGRFALEISSDLELVEK